MAKSPKSPRRTGNRGRGTQWWRQILNRKWIYTVLRMCSENTKYNRYLRPKRRNFRVLQEIVVEEHDDNAILYTELGYGADSAFHRTYCWFDSMG